MKILHVIPSVDAADGGPSAAVHAMAEGIAALEQEVAVATTRGAGPPERGRIDNPVVGYHRFPRTLPGGWKFSWPLTRWLYANVGSYDVVHIHALFSYATIPACRAARSAGVPYILRPLGTLDPWSLRQHAWKKRPYLKLVEDQHLRRAAAIHTTSPAESAGVMALGYGDRVRMVPLGVDGPDRPPGRRSAREGSLRLLFLSRLHPKKGLPLLLDALASLRAAGSGPSPQLRIVGGGDPAYVRELADTVRRLGLQEDVEFLGHLTGPAKQAALAWADVFVLPSYQENFGLAVAEAMAAGLPVIVSDAVALAEEVRASSAGVVVQCDPAEIAAAIWSLGADAQRRHGMGERGAKLVRERFSWRATCAALLEVYREVVGQESRS